ncbi:MAG: Ig-like domain-containing protein, partial [Desulfurivibrionaceae bacterium]
MGSYQILDYLSRYMPTATQMGMAQALSFSAYTPSISFMAIYDHEAKYYESEDYASLRDLFRVNFTEGATYHIYSSSFFDPFLLSVHDSQGRFIAVDNGTTYGSDSISHFIAPYTGTYYVNASWDQGYADSHKFVYLSILEDIDTATPADSTPPTVIAFSPTDEAAGIAITENIVVTFSEAIQRGTGSIVLKTASGIPVATYNASASSNLSVSGSTLTINPTNILVYGTGYKIEFATGSIKDMAGNICAGTTSYNFTTTAAPDITAPTI